jgi:hypothetical protein
VEILGLDFDIKYVDGLEGYWAMYSERQVEAADLMEVVEVEGHLKMHFDRGRRAFSRL